jgi:hypothetical protein
MSIRSGKLKFEMEVGSLSKKRQVEAGRRSKHLKQEVGSIV